VDHALPIPQDPVRLWRKAAFVMTAIAAAELLVLLGIGAYLVLRPAASARASSSIGTAARTTRHRPARPTLLPRGRTRVLVLNGNGQTGAAATEAEAVKARGYRISGVGNAPRPTTGPSLVMYRPGFSVAAKRLARDTGIGIVSALDGLRPGMLHRAQLVIVIGSS
jgi:hypothetical protein